MNRSIEDFGVRKLPYARRIKGFTLIEVMVALLIIAIGLLGIAKMQALALSNTGASRMRALAAIEATSLAEAMHANRAYWASYTSAPGAISVSVSAGTPTVTIAGANLAAAFTSVATAPCGTSTTFNTNLSCYCLSGSGNACGTTYVNMAASDLYDWVYSLAGVLPSANATVTCNPLDNPIDCTINIQWTENAVAANSNEVAAIKSNTTAGTSANIQQVSYSLYIVP